MLLVVGEEWVRHILMGQRMHKQTLCFAFVEPSIPEDFRDWGKEIEGKSRKKKTVKVQEHCVEKKKKRLITHSRETSSWIVRVLSGTRNNITLTFIQYTKERNVWGQTEETGNSGRGWEDLFSDVEIQVGGNIFYISDLYWMKKIWGETSEEDDLKVAVRQQRHECQLPLQSKEEEEEEGRPVATEISQETSWASADNWREDTENSDYNVLCVSCRWG